MEKSKVYFTKNITPTSLLEIYEKLEKKVSGSTGELGGHNYLKPELIKELVQKVEGTIIECNTAYAGNRNTTEAHLENIKAHGFDKIAKVDIMDATEDMEIPVNGKHLDVNIVGKSLENYDFIINLAHFKGHQMGGFGGVIKNQSIGIASSRGKAYIHSVGKTKNVDELWKEENTKDQEGFLESMAESALSVHKYMNGNIVYINVLNNLSVDCDCNSNPEKPCMEDIGIMASIDPLALDQASIDMIWNSKDPGRDHFIQRVERQNGRHILPYSESIGLGSREYELINID